MIVMLVIGFALGVVFGAAVALVLIRYDQRPRTRPVVLDFTGGRGPGYMPDLRDELKRKRRDEGGLL